MNRCMLSNVGLAEIKFYTIVNLLRFLQSHLDWIIARTITVLPVGARRPSGLERVPARYVRHSQMCPQLDVSDKNDQKTQDMSDKARFVRQK